MFKTPIKSHLEKTGEALSSFSDRIGVSPNTMRKIVYGQRSPSIHLSLRIEAATDGAVRPADWLTWKLAKLAQAQ